MRIVVLYNLIYFILAPHPPTVPLRAKRHEEELRGLDRSADDARGLSR